MPVTPSINNMRDVFAVVEELAALKKQVQELEL